MWNRIYSHTRASSNEIRSKYKKLHLSFDENLQEQMLLNQR